MAVTRKQETPEAEKLASIYLKESKYIISHVD
jgi:hypothetical protein